MLKVADLPNGHELFVEETEQGRAYWSGEVGGGVQVWHTALVDEHTLLAAIVEEHRRYHADRRAERARLRELVVNVIKTIYDTP